MRPQARTSSPACGLQYIKHSPAPAAGVTSDHVQARRGGLANTPADDLLATLFKATFAKTGVPAQDVGDVVIGSVLGPSSQRANECRIAMFLAGMPETVPVHTVNRCASHAWSNALKPGLVSSLSTEHMLLMVSAPSVSIAPHTHRELHPEPA
jgi:Thiolase, N-terminal domain